jgi:hypothetical protein
MTTASASTEARVSYQLFQSSRMRPRSKARLALRKIPLSKGRASATKNAMLRLVARVLIARHHGLCRGPLPIGTIRTPVFAKMDCRRGVTVAPDIFARQSAETTKAFSQINSPEHARIPII